MPVLFLTKVYQFEDQRDSSNRVSVLDENTEGHRDMVLNPFFMTDGLVDATYGSSWKYSDNIGDRREKWSRIIIDHTIAEVIAHADTAAHTNAITLPIYPHANPWGTPFFPLRTTVDTTIPWAAIAYAIRYNPDPQHKCWVVYDKGSFKRVEVLCNLALEDVPDLIRGAGTTSTTFSTVDDIPEP